MQKEVQVYLADKLNHFETVIKSALKTKVYFSLGEAAQYLGVSKSTLYKHTSAGNIPFYKPNGKLITFLRDDLDAWILGCRIPSKEELLNNLKEGGLHE